MTNKNQEIGCGYCVFEHDKTCRVPILALELRKLAKIKGINSKFINFGTYGCSDFKHYKKWKVK